ncbi:ATP-dependent DNA ligase [Frigoribacterium sp. PvP032]|uniref:DUF7882 family protein n=1 Tax=Frigoribacterium sp. PvP032 TaxID=2806589 RepID=UPI001AE74626|nr:ATP-dependent DNA ligase [Frigoribacterium sp. PvP032]MBP1189044.1 hypothetical protein [Frigoribacterium sp. PvP032]
MGTLLVAGRSFPFGDRTLAHIRVAFALELRDGPGFFFSWQRHPHEGGGRFTLWVPTTEAVLFEFEGSREPTINRAWVSAILSAPGRGGGLRLVPEPDGPVVVDGAV